MPSLRLLADDLTGALDTAAEFVGAFGPLEVVWSARPPHAASFAIDSGTREVGSDEAFAIVSRLAPLLDGATIAYKKIDSLLRGPWVAELDACLRGGRWDACIVAPAFPHQGRVTRNGRQFSRGADGGWTAAGNDIVAQLQARGMDARIGDPAEALQNGISVFDADADADLDRVAGIGRAFRGRLLWCGSGGLAAALARGTDVAIPRTLKTPVLGIFGSDHAATALQLSACGRVMIASADVRSDIGKIRRVLDTGLALVKLETPVALSRHDAAGHFAREIAHLVQSIDPPKTLIIAGGETLKAQMLAVGADALQVIGRLEPGLPKSVIKGGPWAGVDVISKSGAFGAPDLWSKLLRLNGLL
jgi:D-threonate/D-erythronate kinase